MSWTVFERDGREEKGRGAAGNKAGLAARIRRDGRGRAGDRTGGVPRGGRAAGTGRRGKRAGGWARAFLLLLLLFLPLCPARAGEEEKAPDLGGLAFTGWLDLSYARCVRIAEYDQGYRVIEVKDDRTYLVVPQGKEVPEGIPEGTVVLRAPQERIYLAASSAMALFHAIGGMDHILFSSLTAENWYVPEAREAMEKGEILFAGKYSDPDYELLLDEECSLAVESTMICHVPKVQEMLERLGIPVFIDRSSYEDHPLGRSEWVKVYGVLTGREEEAREFFDSQAEVMEESRGYEKTGRKVAFFSVNSRGQVTVRESSDYIPRMIELAGGEYALKEVASSGEETSRSTLNMSMEEFYASAIDADYLVYNASIEAPLRSVSELLDKSGLFADFKAVKEGRVWCTEKVLYQATDIVGTLIRDFHLMLTGGDEEDITFLQHLQ